MKIEKLEELELRKRIFDQMSDELWAKAENEFCKSEIYKRWQKENFLKRFWILGKSKDFLFHKKMIQMRLLDKEVDDALGVKNE